MSEKVSKFDVTKVSDECFENPLSTPLLAKSETIQWYQEKCKDLVRACKNDRDRFRKQARINKTLYVKCKISESNEITREFDRKIESNSNEIKDEPKRKKDEIKDKYDEKKNSREIKRCVPSTAKDYLIKIKRQHDQEERVKSFKNRMQKLLLSEIWTKTLQDQENKIDEIIDEKVLTQSQYEMQMMTNLCRIHLHDNKITENRQRNYFNANASENFEYEKRAFREDKVNEKTFYELVEKIHEERVRMIKEKDLKICSNIVHDLIDISIKASECLTENIFIPLSFWNQWKPIFIKGLPIFQSDFHKREKEREESENEESFKATEIEKEREKNEQEENEREKKEETYQKDKEEESMKLPESENQDADFEAYHNIQSPWDKFLPEVDESTKEILKSGEIVLGYVVHKSLNFRYPLAVDLEPVLLPKVDHKIIILGLPDTVLLKLQQLLLKNGFKLILLQDAIDYCLSAFKEELKNHEYISLTSLISRRKIDQPMKSISSLENKNKQKKTSEKVKNKTKFEEPQENQTKSEKRSREKETKSEEKPQEKETKSKKSRQEKESKSDEKSEEKSKEKTEEEETESEEKIIAANLKGGKKRKKRKSEEGKKTKAEGNAKEKTKVKEMKKRTDSEGAKTKSEKCVKQGSNMLDKQVQTPKNIPYEDENPNLSETAYFGKCTYDFLKAGQPITVELTTKILIQYLKSLENTKGWVFADYPNNYSQMKSFESALSGYTFPNSEQLKNPISRERTRKFGSSGEFENSRKMSFTEKIIHSEVRNPEEIVHSEKNGNQEEIRNPEEIVNSEKTGNEEEIINPETANSEEIENPEVANSEEIENPEVAITGKIENPEVANSEIENSEETGNSEESEYPDEIINTENDELKSRDEIVYKFSKLVASPNINRKEPKTFITNFIQIVKQNGSEKLDEEMETFYSNLGIVNVFNYLDFDAVTLKKLERLIVCNFVLGKSSAFQNLEYSSTNSNTDFKNPKSSDSSLDSKNFKQSNSKHLSEPNLNPKDHSEPILSSKDQSQPSLDSKHHSESFLASEHHSKSLSGSDHLSKYQSELMLIPQNSFCSHFSKNVDVKPGDEFWEWANFPQSDEVLETISILWENLESSYVANLKKTLFIKRIKTEEMFSLQDFALKCMEEFVCCDRKQEIFNAFYEEFNEITRLDSDMKCELKCRLEDIQMELFEVCDGRKKEAEEERQLMIKDDWIVTEIISFINIYVEILQIELDRFTDTIQILQDYYNSMLQISLEKKIQKVKLLKPSFKSTSQNEKKSENYFSIDPPDATDFEALQNEIRDFVLAVDNLDLPTEKCNSKKSVGNSDSSEFNYNSDLSELKYNADLSESKHNKDLSDLKYNTNLSESKYNKDLSESKYNTKLSESKYNNLSEYDSGLFNLKESICYSAVKLNINYVEKCVNFSERFFNNMLIKLEEKEESEFRKSSDLENEEKHGNLFQEWHYAIMFEINRIKIRLKILNKAFIFDTTFILDTIQGIFNQFRTNLVNRYKREMDSIIEITNTFLLAIEEGKTIKHEMFFDCQRFVTKETNFEEFSQTSEEELKEEIDTL